MVVTTSTAHSPRQTGVLRISGWDRRAHEKGAGRRVRVCSVNVGTVVGRGGELVEMMARRRVDIMLFAGSEIQGKRMQSLHAWRRSLQVLVEWKPKWSGRSWNNVEERPRGGGGGGRKNQPSNNEGQDSDGRKSCPGYICLCPTGRKA